MEKSLRQKLGQLFILGFSGKKIQDCPEIVSDIRDNNISGVVIFDRLLAKNQSVNNIESPTQLKKLTTDLQNLSPTTLLICVDQEGGQVCRLNEKNGFTKTLSAAKLGKDSYKATYQQSLKIAKTLNDCAINLNFSPVVDLNCYANNPIIAKYERSFSREPIKVTKHAQAWIRAHKKYNVLCCLKHFPGHGSSHTDSHLGFVDITNTYSSNELIPFKELIDSGYASSIMTGHLYNNNLDTVYPATLSHNTLTTLLRNKMGFEGVIISDDMQMKAISKQYGLEHAVCMAISAGVDLVIIGNNLEYTPKILPRLIDKIIEAMNNGMITLERIENAIENINILKKTLK